MLGIAPAWFAVRCDEPATLIDRNYPSTAPQLLGKPLGLARQLVVALMYLLLSTFSVIAVAQTTDSIAVGNETTDDRKAAKIEKGATTLLKKATVITLFVQANGEIISLRAKGSAARVMRLEDGRLHVVPIAAPKTRLRAIDFLERARREDTLAAATTLANRIDSVRRGYSDGQKVYWDDEDNQDGNTAVVYEMVEISGNKDDYTDWGLTDPAERYENCIERCTATCIGQLSGVNENVTCLFYGAVGALACLPSGPGSILCGLGTGASCFLAMAWARSECPAECTSICW